MNDVVNALNVTTLAEVSKFWLQPLVARANSPPLFLNDRADK